MERLMRRSAALVALTGLVAVAGSAQAPNTLTDAERSAGWKLLFDGSTTAGWHGYGRPDMPTGWQAIDGALTRVALAGDIVTDAKYRDFELTLEWKVEPGGNSGIFYRGVEGEDPRKTPLFHSAPEMQVLDDERHADGKSPLTSAGAAYGLYPAPRGVVKPANQWNSARLIVRGNQVEHWLNGAKVVEYLLGSPDWIARVKGSKFAAWPRYGQADEGVIGLQDHGDRVAFRSIKIRPLP
jgi:Domain of Unknown Function (DUF1080)